MIELIEVSGANHTREMRSNIRGSGSSRYYRCLDEFTECYIKLLDFNVMYLTSRLLANKVWEGYLRNEINKLST